MRQLLEILEYQFITHAIWAVLLTSVISGIVGTYIVTRRMVFVGGGITHASFGGIGMAYYYGLPPFMGAALFAMASALGIEWMSIKGKVREDSAIAILWSLGMAVGILFMFLTPGYAPNLMGFLFGDILTVKTTDLYWLLALLIFLVAAMALFYRPVLYTAFDADFSAVNRYPVKTIRFIISAIVSIAIVLAIKVTGIILVLSLFTIPQAIANLYLKQYIRLMIVSTIVSALSSLAGLFLAYYWNLPTGAVIIFLLTVLYLIVKTAHYFTSRTTRTFSES